MAITFKKYKHTGRYRGFQKKFSDIKLNRKNIGTINETADYDWSISIMEAKERTEADPAPFRWVRFKARFKTEDEARAWFLRKFDDLSSLYDFHQQD